MLEMRGLSLGRSGRCPIQNVNLSFAPGKIYGVIGKSGSGKSELLEFCAGLRTCKKGSVLLCGKELSKVDPSDRMQKISYLPQEQKVSNITAGRYMKQKLTSNSEIKDAENVIRRVYSALGTMWAAGCVHYPLSALSCGERQRVYLASVFAQDADWILLDEPTAHLDMDRATALMELLQRKRQEGKTIIMVLPDVHQAIRYCDELVVLDMGKEAHTGTPDALVRNGVLKKVFRTFEA